MKYFFLFFLICGSAFAQNSVIHQDLQDVKLLLAGNNPGVSSYTPTITPTFTPTGSPTYTSTFTPNLTWTQTPTFTPTPIKASYSVLDQLNANAWANVYGPAVLMPPSSTPTGTLTPTVTPTPIGNYFSYVATVNATPSGNTTLTLNNGQMFDYGFFQAVVSTNTAGVTCTLTLVQPGGSQINTGAFLTTTANNHISGSFTNSPVSQIFVSFSATPATPGTFVTILGQLWNVRSAMYRTHETPWDGVEVCETRNSEDEKWSSPKYINNGTWVDNFDWFHWPCS